MLQDAAFLPVTLTPGLAASLPPLTSQSLNGRVDTFNANVKVAANATDRLTVIGTYARDVRDNKTPIESYPAVSTDMFVGAVPRSNVPFSFIQDRFKLSGDYRVPSGMVASAGIDQDNRQRTYQETVHTYDTTIWGRAVLRPMDTMSLTFKLAHGDRTNSGYGVATQVDPAENPLLRKFYLADRLRNAATVRADFTVNETINIGLGADYANDDYQHSTIGLTDDRVGSLVGDVSVALSEQTQLHVFAQGEWTKSHQVGSQVYAQPDWTGETNDTFYVGGIGIKHLTLGGKLELAGDFLLSRSRSNVTVNAGAAAPPFPTATTSLDALRLKATYRLKDNLSLIGSYWYENYDSQDWHVDGVPAGDGPEPARVRRAGAAIPRPRPAGSRCATASSAIPPAAPPRRGSRPCAAR